MRSLTIILIGMTATFSAAAQKAGVEDLMFGYNFIESTWYTEAEDLELLELYDGLRVADVSDGMDMAGLPNTGFVDPEIHPAWTDVTDMSHIIRGIALTVRYVPTQKSDRPEPGAERAAMVRTGGGTLLCFSWQPTQETTSPGMPTNQLRIWAMALPSASRGWTATGGLAGIRKTAEPSANTGTVPSSRRTSHGPSYPTT